MAAPAYHVDTTDVSSGAPSIMSHTPNMHDDGTSNINSTVQNNTSLPRTDIPSGGTLSFVSHTPIHHAKGTTAPSKRIRYRQAIVSIEYCWGFFF
eukprot:scaffold64168_cov78-Attheya_sp.AAC.4